jgi:hypothetical protein
MYGSFVVGRYLSQYCGSLRARLSRNPIPVGGEMFRTRRDRLWGPPSPLYNGYRLSFVGRDVDHPPTPV